MGVVLNPIAYRMGYKFSWFDAWFSHRSTYSMFIHNIFRTKLLINYIFFRYFFFRLVFWLYSHSNVYILNNKVFLALYIYDSNTDLFFLRKNLWKLKYIKWNDIKIISEWYKFQILDRKDLLKRFFNFTRMVRFFFDFLNYANLGPILSWNKTYYKLKHIKEKKIGNFYKKKKKLKLTFFKNIYKILKKKKNIKILYDYTKQKQKKKIKQNDKAPWFAREELQIYKWPFFKQTRKLNGFSLKWWMYHYDLYYSKSSSKFRKSKKFWSRSNLFRSEIAKSNIKLYIYFCAFVNKFFVKYNRHYPYRNFQYRGIKKFLRFYIYFFIKKKLLGIHKNFFEMATTYIDSCINVKIYIVGNRSVTAHFITRFVSSGLKFKHRYKFIISPIKKMLNKLLYSKLNLRETVFEELYTNDKLQKSKLMFKYDLFFINNLLKNKKYYFNNILSNVFYANKYKYVLYTNKIKYLNCSNFYFSNLKIKEVLIIKKNNLFDYYVWYLLNYKKKFKNFSNYKCATNHINLKKTFDKTYKYLKLNFNFLYFQFILLWLKNNLLVVYSKDFFFTRNLVKNIKKFFYNFLISKINYNKLNLKLFKFKRNKIKTRTNGLTNFYSLFLLNIFKIYINKNNLSELNNKFNEDYNLLYDYLKNSIKYRNKKNSFSYFKQLYIFFTRFYKKKFKKSLKIVKKYRNQIITIKYISYKGKWKYQSNIEMLDILKNWYREKKIWYKTIKTIFKKYIKINNSNSNISQLKKNILVERQFTINNISKIEIIIYIYFFFNFYLFLFLNSCYYLKLFNNNTSLYFNMNKQINLLYYYFYKTLIRNNVFLQNVNKINVFFYRKNFINIIHKKIKFFLNFKTFNFVNKYSKKFYFSLNIYKKYLFYLKNTLNINIIDYIYNKELNNLPISTKKLRMNFFLKHNVLYGYKFHFLGRFTRKQKSANLWFTRGYLEVSSMISRIDYSVISVILRFSVCSIKVWLYKSKKFPTYKYNVFV